MSAIGLIRELVGDFDRLVAANQAQEGRLQAAESLAEESEVQKDVLVKDIEVLVKENAEMTKEVATLKAEVQRLKEAALVAQPKPQVMIWSDDFENLPKDGPGNYALDAPVMSMGIMLTPQGSALRVRCSSDQNKDKNQTRRRSELGLWEPGKLERIFRQTPHGVEEWFAISVRFPNVVGDSGKAIFLQWHAGPSDPLELLSRNPPLSFEYHADKRLLRCVQLWSVNKVQTANENRSTLFEAPIEAGKWYRIVVHARWGWDILAPQPPTLEIWLNGAPRVVQLLRPNCYNDEAAYVFTRFGLYCPNFTETVYDPPITHVADFARLRIGSVGATLEQML